MFSLHHKFTNRGRKNNVSPTTTPDSRARSRLGIPSLFRNKSGRKIVTLRKQEELFTPPATPVTKNRSGTSPANMLWSSTPIGEECNTPYTIRHPSTQCSFTEPGPNMYIVLCVNNIDFTVRIIHEIKTQIDKESLITGFRIIDNGMPFKPGNRFGALFGSRNFVIEVLEALPPFRPIEREIEANYNQIDIPIIGLQPGRHTPDPSSHGNGNRTQDDVFMEAASNELILNVPSTPSIPSQSKEALQTSVVDDDESSSNESYGSFQMFIPHDISISIEKQPFSTGLEDKESLLESSKPHEEPLVYPNTPARRPLSDIIPPGESDCSPADFYNSKRAVSDDKSLLCDTQFGGAPGTFGMNHYEPNTPAPSAKEAENIIQALQDDTSSGETATTTGEDSNSVIPLNATLSFHQFHTSDIPDTSNASHHYAQDIAASNAKEFRSITQTQKNNIFSREATVIPEVEPSLVVPQSPTPSSHDSCSICATDAADMRNYCTQSIPISITKEVETVTQSQQNDVLSQQTTTIPYSKLNPVFSSSPSKDVEDTIHAQEPKTKLSGTRLRFINDLLSGECPAPPLPHVDSQLTSSDSPHVREAFLRPPTPYARSSSGLPQECEIDGGFMDNNFSEDALSYLSETDADLGDQQDECCSNASIIFTNSLPNPVGGCANDNDSNCSGIEAEECIGNIDGQETSHSTTISDTIQQQLAYINNWLSENKDGFVSSLPGNWNTYMGMVDSLCNVADIPYPALCVDVPGADQPNLVSLCAEILNFTGILEIDMRYTLLNEAGELYDFEEISKTWSSLKKNLPILRQFAAQTVFGFHGSKNASKEDVRIMQSNVQTHLTAMQQWSTKFAKKLGPGQESMEKIRASTRAKDVRDFWFLSRIAFLPAEKFAQQISMAGSNPEEEFNRLWPLMEDLMRYFEDLEFILKQNPSVSYSDFQDYFYSRMGFIRDLYVIRLKAEQVIDAYKAMKSEANPVRAS
ncbi:hypothetical protein BDQ12DRAFT_736378 [Crucibulum laeve]|uniref:Uncharacterized protein n=1 Tax=Crucibulum laeve TaxID=68775 RepID=A0A5C3M7U4_9AGAR|nr:hypothetical protein BDQ12DRAFT_736378 [Crucibulum laeve]